MTSGDGNQIILTGMPRRRSDHFEVFHDILLVQQFYNTRSNIQCMQADLLFYASKSYADGSISILKAFFSVVESGSSSFARDDATMALQRVS